MAMVRLLATNPAQKLFFLSFTSAEGKGAPLPFWGPSQSFGFSLFPLPVSGDLRLLSANTWSPLCDPHSFLNGHFFWRLDTVNSNTSCSNFISLLPVGYHVTIYKKRVKRRESIVRRNRTYPTNRHQGIQKHKKIAPSKERKRQNIRGSNFIFFTYMSLYSQKLLSTPK